MIFGVPARRPGLLAGENAVNGDSAEEAALVLVAKHPNTESDDFGGSCFENPAIQRHLLGALSRHFDTEFNDFAGIGEDAILI